MTEFEVRRHTGQSAVAAWELLTDWERHGEFIPFTTVRLTASSLGDDGPPDFVARTSLGPLHFDDPMQITLWQPPSGGEAGVCRIVKRGRVVTGWAVLTITPTVTGCTITWREDAAVRYTGALLAWPTRVGAARVFGGLVDKLLSTPTAG